LERLTIVDLVLSSFRMCTWRSSLTFVYCLQIIICSSTIRSFLVALCGLVYFSEW
jgi:hypothetical protein